jgi:hypothetical protein
VRELVTRDLWPKEVPIPGDALDQPLAQWFRNKVVDEYEIA